MDKKVQIGAVGGVDQLTISADEPSAPGPGEIRVRHEAIGVSFIDIYHRTGLYPLPLPSTLGVEGAGVVEAVGPDVISVAPGDRVVYAGAPVGAYASTRLLPEWRAIALPDEISAEMAAGSMLRGISAHMLLTRTYPVDAETTILVHAAAGGMGGLLVRWAKRLGAHVIGTAGSPDKAELARAAGADHVIVGRAADIVAEIAACTEGRGVDVVYDGVGGNMLARSLACARPFGVVASIGQAGGPIPPINVDDIGPRRALTLARPSFMAYSAHRQTYKAAAEAVLALMPLGVVGPVSRRYALENVADAHADLESGRSTGSLVLIP